MPAYNLTHPSEVKALLLELDFHPSKVLGQNFLVDRNTLEIILREARLAPGAEVLEVGPGLGVLTEGLLAQGARVVAVERDARLADWLRRRFAGAPGLQLLQADALDMGFAAAFSGPGIQVVSNLPYSVASRVLIELAESALRPRTMLVTVQKEVAHRLAAATQTHDYGVLGVFIQRLYEVKTLRTIPATCFYPPPEIQSCLVRLQLRAEPLGGPLADLAVFKKIVKQAFAHRRKQLVGALRGMQLDLSTLGPPLGIDPQARPETIPPPQWVALANAACAAR